MSKEYKLINIESVDEHAYVITFNNHSTRYDYLLNILSFKKTGWFVVSIEVENYQSIVHVIDAKILHLYPFESFKNQWHTMTVTKFDNSKSAFNFAEIKATKLKMKKKVNSKAGCDWAGCDWDGFHESYEQMVEIEIQRLMEKD